MKTALLQFLFVITTTSCLVSMAQAQVRRPRRRLQATPSPVNFPPSWNIPTSPGAPVDNPGGGGGSSSKGGGGGASSKGGGGGSTSKGGSAPRAPSASNNATPSPVNYPPSWNVPTNPRAPVVTPPGGTTSASKDGGGNEPNPTPSGASNNATPSPVNYPPSWNVRG